MTASVLLVVVAWSVDFCNFDFGFPLVSFEVEVDVEAEEGVAMERAASWGS